MEKHELLAKGNDLVEKINAAMSNIEVIDIEKITWLLHQQSCV